MASRRPRRTFHGRQLRGDSGELLESEVFGHERGAFSGAHQRHLGYAERARGGVLFLDEIADMPLALQSKMLRVLEDRPFHRVGGEATFRSRRASSARQAKTSTEHVRLGGFARTFSIGSMQSPWNCRRFANGLKTFHGFCRAISRYFAEQDECELRGISSLAEEAALSHAWRGNVRELRNRFERAVTLATGPWLMPADLFPELSNAVRQRRSCAAPGSGARRRGKAPNRARAPRDGRSDRVAAKRLDISRTTLWEKMRRYGIVPDRKPSRLSVAART